MFIYKITHRIYGTSYIGQTTKTIKNRWICHVSDALRNNKSFRLQRAIRKYGPDAFDVEEVCSCSSVEELNQTEILCIDIFNTLAPNGYNLTTGGEGTPGHKRRKGYKKPPPSPETRKKIGDAHRGRTLSLEHRQKMSASHRIRLAADPDFYKRMGEKAKGRKMSAETRAKQKIAAKLRIQKYGLPPRYPDTAEKARNTRLKNGKKRKPLSAESRLRMSISAKNRRAREAKEAQ